MSDLLVVLLVLFLLGGWGGGLALEACGTGIATGTEPHAR